MQNNKLSDFSAWQWELAIVASRFELGLFSDDEIIAFTHKLMDKGYYDDVMLDIIDDRQIHLNDITIKKFQIILDLFQLPKLTNENCLYLNTLQRIFPFSQQPNDIENVLYLTNCDEFYENFYDLICVSLYYIDIEDISCLFSKSDDDLSFYLQNYISAEQLIKTFSDLNNSCYQWLNRNQFKILEIMQQFFPQT